MLFLQTQWMVAKGFDLLCPMHNTKAWLWLLVASIKVLNVAVNSHTHIVA